LTKKRVGCELKERLSKRAVVKEKWLGKVFSSTEKVNTKENLARAMAKSGAERRTVTAGRVGWVLREQGSTSVSTSETT